MTGICGITDGQTEGGLKTERVRESGRELQGPIWASAVKESRAKVGAELRRCTAFGPITLSVRLGTSS